MGTPPENLEPQPATPVTEPTTEGAATSRNVNPQVLVLVGLIAVVLLAVVYFLFLSGGGDEEAAAPPAQVPAPVATEAPEGGNGDGDNPVETFEVFAARDPFEPLISASGGGGDGTTAPTDGSTPAPGDDGSVPVGDGGAATGGGGTAVGDHRVKVIDVFVEGGNERAQIQVDGTVYTVDEGETFAQNFRLVSTSGSCATILFGDDEFTLCEGEEILK